MMKNFFFLFSFFFFSHAITCQSTFSLVYFTPGEHHSGYNILDNDNSLYISVQELQMYPEIVMLKMDYSGDVEIEKFYGNPEDSLGWFSYPQNMTSTDNGEIILGGSIGKFENGFYPVLFGHFCVFNSELDTVWTRILREDDDSISFPGLGVAVTSMNNYLMCGQYAETPNPSSTKSFIVKYDSFGNLIWNNTYELNVSFEAIGDLSFHENTIYASGTMNYPLYNRIVYKINSNGVIEDSYIGGSTSSHNVITEIIDDNFVQAVPHGTDYVEFTKFNTNLDTIWTTQKVFSDYNHFHRDIDYDWDGNIITCGGGGTIGIKKQIMSIPWVI